MVDGCGIVMEWTHWEMSSVDRLVDGVLDCVDDGVESHIALL